MSTSLVDWLRAQDDETLAALVRLRPDLAVPPPADLTVLATRAGVRAAVHRACDDLDTPTLATLEALVVADADQAPVPRAEVAHLLGPDVPADVLDRALATASAARALVWEAESGSFSLVPAARDVVPRFPGGLGRPAAGVAGSSALPQVLADVDPDERRVLDALAAGPPIGRSRAADPSGPVARLLAKGLLLRVDQETVELPRQVGLALRGDRPSARSPSTRRRWPSATAAPRPSTRPRAGPRSTSCAASRASSRSGAPAHHRCSGRAASACATSDGRRARSTPTSPSPRSSSSWPSAPI